MKQLIGATLASSLVAALLLAGAASAAEQTAVIEISGMTCPSCPYIAAQALEAVDSVKITDGKYDQAAKKVVFDVTYDDAVTTPAAIAAAPREYGYPGRVLAGAGAKS